MLANHSGRFLEAFRVVPLRMLKKYLQNLLAKQDHQPGTVRENSSKKYHDPNKAKKIEMTWTYSKKGAK